jgi:hypothetical protein
LVYLQLVGVNENEYRLWVTPRIGTGDESSNPSLTAKVETTLPQFLVQCTGRIYKEVEIGSTLAL